MYKHLEESTLLAKLYKRMNIFKVGEQRKAKRTLRYTVKEYRKIGRIDRQKPEKL